MHGDSKTSSGLVLPRRKRIFIRCTCFHREIIYTCAVTQSLRLPITSIRQLLGLQLN